MGKEDLRAGLEGWIRNTREVAQDLASPEATKARKKQPAAKNTTAAQEAPVAKKSRTAPKTPAEASASAEALIATLHSGLRAIAEQARLLESLETEADPKAREALVRDLANLARTLAPQTVAPPAPAEEGPPEEGLTVAAGVRQIPGEAFQSEVLKAENPVLVELHLDGHRPCEEARQALAGVAALYDGPVELRTLNVMEAEPEALPQIVKIGRDFLDRNLPKVVLYWRGDKIGEAGGEVSSEDLVELLRSEVKG